MIIGLLTYHAACNFGANLQALSNYCFWKNRGHEPIFINWSTKGLEESYQRNTPEIQFNEHERFREEFFTMTKKCYTNEDIVGAIKENNIEAVVVGSDAVMQTRPLRSWHTFSLRSLSYRNTPPPLDTVCPNPFWGSFYQLLPNKIPLCCMSASSQNSPYRKSSKEEKEIQKSHLLQFSYISTRDDWTSKQINWITDGEINPPITPDPVFAFNYNVKVQPTEQDIRQRFGLNGKYCLFCFHNDKTVSQSWLQEMQGRMNERGVECVALPFPQGIEFHHPFEKQINLPLSPLDWYALIKYATYYIGDNMHPVVISLHNAVPCFSFDHYGIVNHLFMVNERSSKVYHIMKQFGCLENRVSLKGIYREPSVNYVIDKLDGFDKDKVKETSELYLNSYLRMMSDIESVIIQ